tara:strand:- start:618 stop:824 length:207 start_codon:yes stop_codon:yes gene_type:complete
MPDVELVAIMDNALKSRSKDRHVVKVENQRWDKQYKQLWADHINTIDHWQELEYKYMPVSDTFIFFKR